MFTLMLMDKTRKADSHPLGWISAYANSSHGRTTRFAMAPTRHEAFGWETREQADAVAKDLATRTGARFVVVAAHSRTKDKEDVKLTIVA